MEASEGIAQVPGTRRMDDLASINQTRVIAQHMQYLLAASDGGHTGAGRGRRGRAAGRVLYEGPSARAEQYATIMQCLAASKEWDQNNSRLFTVLS